MGKVPAPKSDLPQNVPPPSPRPHRHPRPQRTPDRTGSKTAPQLLIQLLEPRVLALEFGDGVFHEAHHVFDADIAGQGGEAGHHGIGLLVGVLAHLGYADALVEGREGVLLVGEKLFVKFLAGPESGVLDHDVLIRGETGQGDHAPGHLVNLHGLPHVEHENLVPGAHGGGLHHQAAGLGDGHEEARDIRMRHRDGAALGNLLPEAGNHGTVRAQHIAEAGGDEAGLPRHLPALHGQAQALDIDLCQALGAAHDVGGVHSFISRYHHHALGPVFQALVGHILGAEDIHQHGLAGVLLHQGHVFIGGRVEHHLRMPGAEGVIQPLGMADIPDERHEMEGGIFLGQVQPEVVHGRLAVVVEDNLLGAEIGQLPYQFRADGARRARHHHHLAGEEGPDLTQGDGNLRPPQQVFHLHGAGMQQRLPFGDLVHVGDDERLDAPLGAVGQQAIGLGLQVAVVGEDDAANLVVPDDAVQAPVVGEAKHRQALHQVGAAEAGRALQEAAHVITERPLQALDHGHALVGDSVHQDLLLAAAPLEPTAHEVVGQDHGHPHAQQEDGREDHVHDDDDKEDPGIGVAQGHHQQQRQALSHHRHGERDHVPRPQVADDDAVRLVGQEEDDGCDERSGQVQDGKIVRIVRIAQDLPHVQDGQQGGRCRQEEVNGEDQFPAEIGILERGHQVLRCMG